MLIFKLSRSFAGVPLAERGALFTWETWQPLNAQHWRGEHGTVCSCSRRQPGRSRNSFIQHIHLYGKRNAYIFVFLMCLLCGPWTPRSPHFISQSRRKGNDSCVSEERVKVVGSGERGGGGGKLTLWTPDGLSAGSPWQHLAQSLMRLKWAVNRILIWVWHQP